MDNAQGTEGQVQDQDPTLLGGDAGGQGQQNNAGENGQSATQNNGQGVQSGAQDSAGENKQEQKQDAGGAPEKYELTMPEGVELDAALLEKATPVFKELGLTNGQAQKLSTLYADKTAALRKEQIDTWNATVEGWREKTLAAPEFAGDAGKENLALAQTALKQFGTPELTAVIDTYGMGNHPEFVRFCYNVGKALKEDSFVSGGSGGKVVDPGKVLYPGMN